MPASEVTHGFKYREVGPTPGRGRTAVTKHGEDGCLGLRQALGATVSGILGLVVWQGVQLTATGIAVGLGATLAVTRVLETMLFDVSPTDPVTFALVALVLAAVSIAATIVPARRAVRVDPMEALRGE